MAHQGDMVAGRYELASVLGEGGMGVVWRARDVRLGRAVAIKLLSASAVGNAIARARLIREARAAAALEHEGVVRVYDVGETDDGGAYLVMELIRGRSLRDAMLGGDVSAGARAGTIVQAARALAAAHAAGIIHRDVKPDNIMIRPDGHVTVVDFGVAKPVSTQLVADAETIAEHPGKSLTGAGQLVGTPAYLAPEQARGLEVGPATDQFALAVTAYEALSGMLPWRGEGVVEIVASVLRDAPSPISSKAAVAAALDPVIARALEKDPKERYPDMTAFAYAFEDAASALEGAALPSKPSGHVETPPSRGAPPVTEISATKISGADSIRATERRSVGLRSIGVFALAAFVLAAGGWYASRGRTAAAPADAAALPSGAAAALAHDGVVACPAFAITGVDEPWLGGAAAVLACERIELALGGRDARVLSPAELVDAPRDLAEDFGDARLEDATARDRGIAAAKTRAARWIDGKVDRQGAHYSVEVVLRTADGVELARGQGGGLELFEAVRGAIGGVRGALGPPSSEDLEALRRSLDVASVDAALDLLDMRTSALVEDPVSLEEACALVQQRTDLAPRVVYLARATCAKKLRTGALTDPPPPLDDSTPGALVTTALAAGTTGGPEAVKERAARLERARDAASAPEDRARLSAAAAELSYAIGDARSRSLAHMAVLASPKAPDWRTCGWHRFAFSSDMGGSSLRAVLLTWHPWEPIAQSVGGGRTSVDGGMLLGQMRRVYYLGQRGYFATQYGGELVEEGKLDAAANIAEASNDDLLRVEILMGEAKYGRAIETAARLIRAMPASDKTASLAFRLAERGVKASLVLGRSADFVDDVVTRWVLSEPPHVVDGVVPYNALVALCALGPRPSGRRCMDRLQSLRRDAKLPLVYAQADVVLEGASRFVADDYAGAARAWRTMLRVSGWIQNPLRDLLPTGFDRAGAYDLADELDAATVALADLPRTADLAWVRTAKRAAKRGDTAKARRLAALVVERWRFADEDIPAVGEMKELLAKAR